MGIGSVFSQLRKTWLFVSEFGQDFIAYARYCGISPLQDSRKKLFYKILIESHTIEKGLSLAAPRPLFGRNKIEHIMRMVRRYGIGSPDLPVSMACGALRTYSARHRAMGLADPLLDAIDTFLDERDAFADAEDSGGLRIFPDGKPQIAPQADGVLLNRFSCRMFDAPPPEREEIREIVRLAQSAPSQCNRQATRIHYFDDPAQIAQLLELQGGSAGFAETVPGLFVVGFDLAAWGGAQQRNQGYVDGSLFAMALMLAAQARGAVTCPLNLAVPHRTERRIKAVGNIPADQRLVMMMAIGQAAPSDLKAAASPRRPVADILSFGTQRGATHDSQS